MHDSIKMVASVLPPEGQARDASSWEDLLAGMQEITSGPPSQEAESLLLAALRFEGRFHLTLASGRPHRLSPEDMVKSLAIQALGKWGIVASLPEIERIESTARSPGLASVARVTAQRLRKVRELVGSRSTEGSPRPGAADLPDSIESADVRDGDEGTKSSAQDLRGGVHKQERVRLSGFSEDLASLDRPAPPVADEPWCDTKAKETT